MSLPTPNFVTSEEVRYATGAFEFKTLESNVFVRPINITYVPKHVINDSRWDYYNEETNCFCYTPVGIILVPHASMRKL